MMEWLELLKWVDAYATAVGLVTMVLVVPAMAFNQLIKALALRKAMAVATGEDPMPLNADWLARGHLHRLAAKDDNCTVCACVSCETTRIALGFRPATQWKNAKVITGKNARR